MNPYLKSSLRWTAAALIVTLYGLYGCAPTTKQMFNEYHQAYLYETRPTDKSIDVLVTVRIRGFGNASEKQFMWCASWPQFCLPGKPSAGTSVSSAIPEIWIDLREDKRGLVINDMILGHELRHILKLHDARVNDPDR